MIVVNNSVSFLPREAKKKHVQLIKDRKLFQAKISEMEDSCNKMMMQKFGRVVDLEKLEQVTVNRNIEELKEKLRQNEVKCSSEMMKWQVSSWKCYDNSTLS